MWMRRQKKCWPLNAKLEATRKSTKLHGKMTRSDVVFRVNSGHYWDRVDWWVRLYGGNRDMKLQEIVNSEQ